MDIRVKDNSIANLQVQRNGLAGLSLSLLVVVVIQSFLLFFKSPQTIILPPETKQSFWVEGNRFAPVYLEEQGMYFAHLLLDVSASNILAQGEILLRYVDSSHHGYFKTRLFKEEQRLKRDNLSLNFVVCDCEVFPSEMAVEITGDLNGYVASKKISSHRESYRLEFTSVKGRLFLKGFKVIKSDQESYKPENYHPESYQLPLDTEAEAEAKAKAKAES
jgi:conjugal transfer pilus assembly protein TraE